MIFPRSPRSLSIPGLIDENAQRRTLWPKVGLRLQALAGMVGNDFDENALQKA